MKKDSFSAEHTVFLNNKYLPASEATVSPLDRGFLFAHSAYEVTAMYGGKLVDWPYHSARLSRTLQAIDIPRPEIDLEAIHYELMRLNELSEGLFYLQVTAGSYGERDFAGPEQVSATVFLMLAPKKLISEQARTGAKAVLVPDTRWTRRDLKTTQLLSQTLAYRHARQENVDVAFFHQDRIITEAASANAWLVDHEGSLITHHLSNDILHGVTREAVLEVVRSNAIKVIERPFTIDDAVNARELFTTSSGALICPIIELDGVSIGDGKPGSVTRKVQKLYFEKIGVDIPVKAPWVSE